MRSICAPKRSMAARLKKIPAAIGSASRSPELGDENIGSHGKAGDQRSSDEGQQLSQSHGSNRGGPQPSYEEDGDDSFGTLQKTTNRDRQGQCEDRFANPRKISHRDYPSR